MIRRTTRPPESWATVGARASHMVLTAFIPPASRASTKRWTTSMVPRGEGTTRTSRSRAPPPNLTSIGSLAFAAASRFAFSPRIRSRAADGSTTSRTWICPIITGSDVWARNPPVARATFAELEAAAMTLGLPRPDGDRGAERHRDEVVRAVDPEVRGDAQGKGERPDHVLDHPLEDPPVDPRGDIVRARLGLGEVPPLPDDLPALLDRPLVEPRDLRIPLHGT